MMGCCAIPLEKELNPTHLRSIVVKYVQQDATIAFLFSAMALLYMFRATFSRQHDTEQDSDYQQLHNDRTIYY
jgi:hypothetical protein